MALGLGGWVRGWVMRSMGCLVLAYSMAVVEQGGHRDESLAEWGGDGTAVRCGRAGLTVAHRPTCASALPASHRTAGPRAQRRLVVL